MSNDEKKYNKLFSDFLKAPYQLPGRIQRYPRDARSINTIEKLYRRVSSYFGFYDPNKPDLQKPPKSAEFLIYIFVKRQDREVILGDLEEDFHEVRHKFGKRYASFQYWCQVLRSIWPFMGTLFKNLVLTAIDRFKSIS